MLLDAQTRSLRSYRGDPRSARWECGFGAGDGGEGSRGSEEEKELEGYRDTSAGTLFATVCPLARVQWTGSYCQ